MSRPFAYEQLCTVAAERGLHVELWTDHRSKQAKDATLGPPQVAQLVISGDKRKIVHRTPTTLRTLEHVAAVTLGEIPR